MLKIATSWFMIQPHRIYFIMGNEIKKSYFCIKLP